MKKLVFTLIVILFACMMVSCSEYDKDYVYDGTSLVGKWQEEDFDEGLYKIYEFKEDGTVTYTFYTYGIVYSADLNGVTQEYRVEGNNTLVLVDNYNNGTNKIETKVNFSIDEDNQLVLHDDGEDINILHPYSLPYDDISPIVGKWISETETDSGKIQKDLFWFLENGECLIFANVSGEIGDDVDEFSEKYIDSEVGFIQSMLYATSSDNKINICFAGQSIISEESVLQGTYTLSNGRLSIISEGETIAEFVRLEDDFV